MLSGNRKAQQNSDGTEAKFKKSEHLPVTGLDITVCTVKKAFHRQNLLFLLLYHRDHNLQTIKLRQKGLQQKKGTESEMEFPNSVPYLLFADKPAAMAVPGMFWEESGSDYLPVSHSSAARFWAIFSRSSGVMFQTKRNTIQLPTAQSAGNSRHSTLIPRMVPVVWTAASTL